MYLSICPSVCIPFCLTVCSDCLSLHRSYNRFGCLSICMSTSFLSFIGNIPTLLDKKNLLIKKFSPTACSTDSTSSVTHSHWRHHYVTDVTSLLTLSHNMLTNQTKHDTTRLSYYTTDRDKLFSLRYKIQNKYRSKVKRVTYVPSPISAFFSGVFVAGTWVGVAGGIYEWFPACKLVKCKGKKSEKISWIEYRKKRMNKDETEKKKRRKQQKDVIEVKKKQKMKQRKKRRKGWKRRREEG